MRGSGLRRIAIAAAVALCVLAAANQSAEARHGARLRVSVVDRSATKALRHGSIKVHLRGRSHERVKVRAKVVSLAGKRPRTVTLAKSRKVRLGKHGRKSPRLRLTAAGRTALRVALARCRVAKVSVRAKAKHEHARATRTLSHPSSCGLPASASLGKPKRNAKPAHFVVGAATADFSPPLHGAVADDASDCPAPGFDGPRKWAFMEPYKDTDHFVVNPTDPGPPEEIPVNGHYDDGDPYVDCNGNGRWDGNFIAGGSGGTRYYDKVLDPVTSRAVVVSNGRRTIAVEVTDQEGLFNVYQEQIRQQVESDLHGALKDGDMFLSATHDESAAPQTLGLNGATDITSATNDYYLDFFIKRSAKAIEQAYANRRAATIHYVDAHEPSNFRQCWSSYPYVDDMIVPTLQAVGDDGKTIATVADVSQHTETLGFNQTPGEWTGVSADWPAFFRDALEKRYGGVAIEMAGSVGSVESPEVFPGAVPRTPEKFISESHPAGCRTLFNATGKHVPLGYHAETQAYGEQLATAVAKAIDDDATPSVSNEIAGSRTDICVPVTNQLFAAAGAAGVFAHRPSYTNGCTVQVGPTPNGSTSGQEAKSQVAAFRIGDGSFISVPGEVFPFTYLRSFLGPNDLPYNEPLPAWLIPHMHTDYRFVNGLAEDMIGYIFPSGNGVGVPGERGSNAIDSSSTDRFGCGHSDDSESANSQAGNIIGDGLVKLLDAGGTKPEQIAQGRYVMPDGTTSRDPLGGPVIKCTSDTVYKPNGPAIGVELADGTVTHPAAWMDAHAQAQTKPDRNTRGYFRPDGSRVWVDVFADVKLP